MERESHSRLTQLATLLLALVFSVMPLPAAVVAFRPDIVAVTLLYWSLVSAGRFSLFTAFWMGLALDTLSASLLGQHALALLLIVYASQRFYLRLRSFPASQLLVTIAALLALYQFVLFWVDGVAGRTVPTIERWGPVVSGTLLWLFVWSAFDRRRGQSPARL